MKAKVTQHAGRFQITDESEKYFLEVSKYGFAWKGTWRLGSAYQHKINAEADLHRYNLHRAGNSMPLDWDKDKSVNQFPIMVHLDSIFFGD